MEYHYFTIEDVEMLKFNGITHLHNHLNYLIHTDKDQKFTNEDSVLRVLSKQIERYEEIEAQNLNLKADIQDEKECLLDLQNKIWRYSHFEKESELITMDMFPSEVKNLFLTFLENSFYEHDYTNESYFDEYLKKHEECIYQGKKLSKGAIQELYDMNGVGYDWLICNKDGRIFFVDHGLYPLEKGEKVWNNKKFDGYSISAFVEDKKKRYKSLVSWEDEQPFNIYEFLLAQDIDMEM